MKLPANQLALQSSLARGEICRVSVVIGARWLCVDEIGHFLAKHVERWEEQQQQSKKRLEKSEDEMLLSRL